MKIAVRIESTRPEKKYNNIKILGLHSSYTDNLVKTKTINKDASNYTQGQIVMTFFFSYMITVCPENIINIHKT